MVLSSTTNGYKHMIGEHLREVVTTSKDVFGCALLDWAKGAGG